MDQSAICVWDAPPSVPQCHLCCCPSLCCPTFSIFSLNPSLPFLLHLKKLKNKQANKQPNSTFAIWPEATCKKANPHFLFIWSYTCIIHLCNRPTPGSDAHTYSSRLSRAGLSAAHGVHIQGIGHCSYHMNTHSNLSNGPCGGLSFGTGKRAKPGYLNHNWSVSWVFLAVFRSCRQREPCCWEAPDGSFEPNISGANPQRSASNKGKKQNKTKQRAAPKSLQAPALLKSSHSRWENIQGI